MNGDDETPRPPAAAAAEPTVKQLLENPAAHNDALDPETLAELQRWFGLPSAMDLPPEPVRRPEHELVLEAALAAVEPAFLAYVQRLSARLPQMHEEPSLPMVIDEAAVMTPERFHGAGRLGEPREVEISYLLEDDLKERVPQALLRDLHRMEEQFGKHLELTPVAEPIPDVRLAVAEAIARGHADRELVSARDELARARAAPVEARRLVPWETLGRAVQSQDSSDVERES